MAGKAIVEGVFAELPKLISDDRGTWISSIDRERIETPVAVLLHGLAGGQGDTTLSRRPGRGDLCAPG